MAVFQIGRSGFHKGEKSIAEAMQKAMDQDTIQIKEKHTVIPQTITIKPGVVIQGDPTGDAPIISGPSRQIAFFIPASDYGTITLRHLRIQLDESSIGIRINTGRVKLILDDVQIYHKKGLDVAYNALVAGSEKDGDPSVEIVNSLIDKVAGKFDSLMIKDSNIGDWFDAHNSQVFFNQAQITGTALQNILVAGNDKSAQLRLTNSALGGNVRFQQCNVAGDTISLTQLPIINHRGKLKPEAGSPDATSLIVAKDAKVSLQHISQSESMDPDKAGYPLPKWRGMGIVGGSLTVDDAYLINTGLKNVARGGDITFKNVTDDSEWAVDNSWGAGPKLHLSNKNSNSMLFEANDGLNGIPSGIAGQPQQHESALQKLDEMIGLKPVKAQVRQIVAQAKANAEREKRGLGNSKLKRRLNMIFAGDAGVGKSLSMNSRIMTPSGWRRFGDLQVGDQVYAPDGQPTTVLGRYPKGKLDVYRVTLADGRHLDTSKDHLFSVYNNYSKKRNELHTMSVQQLLDAGLYHETHGIDRRMGVDRVRYNRSWSIPTNRPLMYPKKNLATDPYVFGVLIAEGSLHSADGMMRPMIVTSDDRFVIDKIAQRLDVDVYRTSGYGWKFKYRYGITKSRIGENGRTYYREFVNAADLVPHDELVTAQYKYLPEDYKQGSYDQRLELLQGLFDTDGSVTAADGRCCVRYSTVSKRLAYDIREVLLSMGYDATILSRKRRATKASRHPRVEYQVTVLASIPDKMKLFTLPRHLDVFKPYLKHKIRRHYDRINIVDIQPLHIQDEMMCIFVDNPSHLYVADDFVVTHNTTVAKLVAEALYEAGVLPSSTFHSVGAADLVSQYVGKTSQQTHDVIMKALDGVLLIDEAYALNSTPNGGSSNNFNQEAITQLVKDMDQYADRLVVIAAGYSQPMKQFLANNQGLPSRFPNWIEFPDYSPTELKLIMRLDLKKAGARLSTPQVINYLDRGIDQLLPVVSSGQGSGNGRFVDNYVQRVTEMRDNRLAQQDLSKLSDLQLMIIKPQDVQQAVDIMKRQSQNIR